MLNVCLFRVLTLKRTQHSSYLPIVSGFGFVLPFPTGLMWFRFRDHIHICKKSIKNNKKKHLSAKETAVKMRVKKKSVPKHKEC